MSKNKILKTVSDYQPAGDQPQAITEIVKNISKKELDQVLLGVTGSGKTFTMAKIIEETHKNAIEIGARNSQTGPAKRKDNKTINKHLDLLSDEGIKKIYLDLTDSIKNRHE